MKYNTDFNDKINYSRKDFRDVLQFYLFECPVKDVSYRGKEFKELGWEGSRDFPKLKKAMLSVEDSDIKQHYFPCKKEELEGAIETCATLSRHQEYCVFLKSDERTVMQSLFKAIRNALAHGSFNIHSYKKIRLYYFENYDKYRKAKILIRETTLISWIKLVQNGPENSKY